MWHVRQQSGYLGVVKPLVSDESRFGDASLVAEGLLVAVGCSRHNGCLTNLAHHQHLPRQLRLRTIAWQHCATDSCPEQIMMRLGCKNCSKIKLI